jgi:hypothetical protein
MFYLKYEFEKSSISIPIGKSKPNLVRDIIKAIVNMNDIIIK